MESKKQAPTALDGSVRGRLLQAAIDLFAQKGYAATTVREIVAAAGVTKPVLYYYFGSKEGLYLEMVENTQRELLALLEDTEYRQGGVLEQLSELAEKVLTLFIRDLKVMKVIHSIYYGPPQGAPFVDFDALHDMFHAETLRLVEQGMENGELRRGDPQDFTWALMSVVHYAIELELCVTKERIGPEHLGRVLCTVFQGIAAQ